MQYMKLSEQECSGTGAVQSHKQKSAPILCRMEEIPPRNPVIEQQPVNELQLPAVNEPFFRFGYRLYLRAASTVEVQG